MGNGIDLVVTDLDGTLWDRREQVHERTVAALADLASRDVPLLVATGRRVTGALRALRHYDLDLPLVALDGAFGTDVHEGVPTRRWHHHPFSDVEALRVLGAFRAAGLSPVAFVDRPGIEVVAEDRTSTSARHLGYIGQALARDDLDRVVHDEPLYGFAVADGDAAAIGQVVGDLGIDGVAYVTTDGFYDGVTITVRPPRTSKWEGVRSFCADRDLDCERVLAVGDGPNDVELLGGAAIACVVADGCDEALALADHVIEPPDAGGWAAVIDLVT